MKKKILSIFLTVCLLVGCVPLSVSAATTNITLGNSVSGSITSSTDKNFYKFSISESGRVNFKFSGTMKWIYLYLFDTDNQQLWSNSYLWNDTSQRLVKELSFDLVAGTYSFCVGQYNQYNPYTGNYTLETSYSPSGESFAESQNRNNDSVNTANSISLGNSYTGQIAYNEEKDFYKFTLAESGRVNFKFNGTMEYIYLYLFNMDNQQLWNDYFWWNGTSQRIVEELNFDLVAGTYSFCVGQYNMYNRRTGNYTLETSYRSAGESFKESQSSGNNSISTASSISLGKTYQGQIAMNDSKDFYKFTTSGNTEIPINFSGNMERITLYVYNSEGDGSKAWKKTYSADSGSGKITVKDNVICNYGTFYFCVEQYRGTGNYSFSLKGDPVDVPDDPSDEKTSVSLNRSSLTLTEGETEILTATVTPADAKDKKVTWSSSNTKVATVTSGGRVTAVSAGTATITAKTASGVTAKCVVTVEEEDDSSDKPFLDVPTNVYYYKAACWAKENGVMAGDGKGHLTPEKGCTRAEVVQVLKNLSGESVGSSGSSFTDVPNSAWYSAAVEWAVANGITSGTGGGKFSPNAKCTRAQIVTFLWNYAGKPTVSSGSSFSDVKRGEYYENAVKWAVANGITSGTGNNKFSPNATCTRGQIVTFLYKYAN